MAQQTMPSLARRALGTASSAPVRLADLATTMQRQGIDVIDLSAGRASESTPGFVVRAATQAMLAGDTHQTMARGRPEYREACARKLARENAIEADPETSILATLGCKQGLMLSLLAVLDPGDEVIIEDPCFVSYQPTVELVGGVPVAVPLRPETGFRWAARDLEAAVTERTKAILFCSPQNPTGAVHSAEDLDAIAAVAVEHDLFVISDEIYERVTWGGRRHISIATRPAMRERNLALMGLTKSFSMGGWRIGFVFGPEPVISAMVTLQQHLITSAGAFTQIGAAAALADPPPPEVTALWCDWERRCEFVASELDRMPGVSCRPPEGGYYAWADISGTGFSSEELAERLLRDYHVAVVPGRAFGPHGEGYLRITCVKSWDILQEAVSRLRDALSHPG
ncbi:MAG: pyridoxal phosphate-dependent aminotransferase [Gemmatimonadetes bacterium]|nr:pyridoxal phosphate-dependent aminotransferase [Gemmatimonadota bacterium]